MISRITGLISNLFPGWRVVGNVTVNLRLYTRRTFEYVSFFFIV